MQHKPFHKTSEREADKFLSASLSIHNLRHAAHTNSMKYRRFAAIVFIVCAAALCLMIPCACHINADSSLKELTHPYSTRYECTSATYGGEDIMGGFEYIRITLLDDSELELAFKPKGGKARAVKSNYTFDEETHELCAEIGALGVKVKESVIVENGKFTISFPLRGKQLIMNFES